MPVFHAFMLSVSYERLPSVSVVSYALADFLLLQITSKCLIAPFPWSFSRESTMYHVLQRFYIY